MWTFCKVCKQGTPIIPMKDGTPFRNVVLILLETWNYSLGKYLEICFYGGSALSRIKNCSHAVHKHHTRYFYFDNLVLLTRLISDIKDRCV